MQAKTYISSSRPYTWCMNQGRPASQQRPPLGEKIASARLQAGLTQIQLAEKLGVSQRVVTYWEREATGLNFEQLAALSETLDVPPDYFLGKTKKKTGGPSGKARRLFEQVSDLPRSQQQRILETVEDMLVARQARNG
jgi:transcriptional regulator with XRE-family HTH domain